MLQKRIMVSLWLITLAVSAFAQEDCPARVTRFHVYGGFQTRSQYALLYMENRSDKAIESVEYQYDAYDRELNTSLGRYFLAVGKITASPGKPIQPGKDKPLQGGVSLRFGVLFGGLHSGEGIKINVIYFTDGTKWERKGWRDEPKP
jgi:hypothetical protein